MTAVSTGRTPRPCFAPRVSFPAHGELRAALCVIAGIARVARRGGFVAESNYRQTRDSAVHFNLRGCSRSCGDTGFVLSTVRGREADNKLEQADLVRLRSAIERVLIKLSRLRAQAIS